MQPPPPSRPRPRRAARARAGARADAIARAGDRALSVRATLGGAAGAAFTFAADDDAAAGDGAAADGAALRARLLALLDGRALALPGGVRLRRVRSAPAERGGAVPLGVLTKVCEAYLSLASRRPRRAR